MHPEATHFLAYVKSVFPTFFTNVKVLDVGSGDINGNNRQLFTDIISYDGNDVAPGRNVTIVSPTSKLPFDDETFDIIISSECFEHDPEWNLSLQKIYKMLKPGGLFCFTCASTGRGEHGTRRTSPTDSLGCFNNVGIWADHYMNLTMDNVNSATPLDTYSQYAGYYNDRTKDLYFWGIKQSDSRTAYSIIPYSAHNCSKVDCAGR